ncbi:glycogen synthase [Rhodohalobacter mucosus]|uniref:Glycogen synthase n=1 Tax=Rhodohalobacter mucosus TaxID=2079485 RepID=A0A316TUT1_9BACT|nr:glycogen synthase [Rhodohalobacter mucosus]PWN07618.1 glycogen synthase [Rhodohalobacter mucosus]
MEIIHITAECYPAAKAGGLGDVAGALPKYLNKLGQTSSVILPYYQTNWLQKASTSPIFEGSAPFGTDTFFFRVHRLDDPDLGFELNLVEIPGRFDRPGIYIDPWSGHPYWDEKERFFSFQIAALEWLSQTDRNPDVIHCHDHHTGLVPFMMNHCFRYDNYSDTPSVITIHNGEYQGMHDIGSYTMLPAFNLGKIGLLDWNGKLNSLAAGIKSAWKVTTVSEGYMNELLEDCHGLETLLRHEKDKTAGILNGIDTDVWDPKTDEYLDKTYSLRNYKSGKAANKAYLCDEFSLKPDKPLFSFIGRLVREKGADLLPDLIKRCREENLEAIFVVLGTGDPALHDVLKQLQGEYMGYFDARLEYNEKLAHRIYAGSDFILMPSRVEPCGLNQLYSMRYGTVPVVRKTGGLADTVTDLNEENGYGLVFDDFDVEQAFNTVKRGVEFFQEKQFFNSIRRYIMGLDFSWEKAAENYTDLYEELKKMKGE